MNHAGFKDLSPGLAAHISGSFSLKIASWSMFPALKKGDLVNIMRQEHYEAGDIVLYRRGENLICHRVVGSTPGQSLETRGDASEEKNIETVMPGEILGKVVTVSRGLENFSPPPCSRPAGRKDLIKKQWDLLCVAFKYRIALLLEKILRRKGPLNA